MVTGTRGYEIGVQSFAKASFGLKFEDINQDFLSFLPALGSKVLDAGCGVGQNAAALCELGYDVCAIEPLTAFLDKAKARYKELPIEWLEDSLPDLKLLNSANHVFDFILLDGVWHHLNYKERKQCINRLYELLAPNGICAFSLRNGPAGLGTHVYPTNNEELSSMALENGLEVVFQVENQPSKMPNKRDVSWSRVALRK
ncbi:class I SAM-dependent methyltransferase [Pseudoalteromonas umbrosa]|uniref:class I SAM-dependent methyltransferase n=1 Tax=Pseudoalteromonas umbrosa TaxID=3048489 RepID=UPI0024C4720B|nr:class I SAM-dependent methyltransferase [Pseudoalteromonas sp. B95]MDK1286139.1 class I SAM-dependent methyltransferase [Pseudoalteromonas sp. B95]